VNNEKRHIEWLGHWCFFILLFLFICSSSNPLKANHQSTVRFEMGANIAAIDHEAVAVNLIQIPDFHPEWVIRTDYIPSRWTVNQTMNRSERAFEIQKFKCLRQKHFEFKPMLIARYWLPWHAQKSSEIPVLG
jgi:hypothetical protein